MTQKKIQRKITRFCVQKLDIDSPIPIDTSAEKYIKEIEENVKKNRVLKNSFLATESKKNLLNQEFKTNTLRSKMVSDITYIYAKNYGWTYLATVEDLCNR